MKEDIVEKIAKNSVLIKHMEYRIDVLSKYAQHVMNAELAYVEVILEDMPNNGIRPVLQPLYDSRTIQQQSPEQISDYLSNPNPAPKPKQIGYMKYYTPDNDVGMLESVGISVTVVTALAIVDLVIKGLKKEILKLKTENNSYIKNPPTK